MVIQVKYKNKTYKVRVKRAKVKSIIEKVGLNPEEYLAVKGDLILTDDDYIKDGDEIKLYDVVSGG